MDARAAQGVQIGDGNQQFNTFMMAPGAADAPPFTAPGLPRHFVPRPRELEGVVGRLLGGAVVVVHGGGGFGKSTLAAAACHDDRVRAAFRDGILWLRFGQATTREGAVALLHDQIRLLAPHTHAANDLGAASAQLRSLLAGRAALLVLDDVWSAGLLPYFLFTGTPCLVTTRLDAVLGRAGGRPVPVGELTAEQAAELLMRWQPEPPDAVAAALLTALAGRLGEWPLMLELVGAELRSLVAAGRTTAEAVAHVERRLALDVGYLDRHSDEDRNAAISSSLDASVSLLRPEHRARFAELAVFPAGADVPFGTIWRLWRATAGYDALAAEDAVEEMYRLALFTRYDVRRRLLRLHDVVQRLIVGRAGDLDLLHRRLLESWGDPRHPPDAYAWTFLIHHLHQLGKDEEIRRLLSDFDWVYRRLQATPAAGLIADFAERCPDRDGEFVTAALRMAGPALSDPAQLAAQLVGRLAGVPPGLPMVERLLEEARRYESAPSLLPERVHLLPADRGVHTRVHVGSPILSAALSEDGAYLLTGQNDGTIGVWDWRRHERVSVLDCGVGQPWSLAVQGELVAVGGAHGSRSEQAPRAPVQVWNWRTGEHVRDLGGDLPDVGEGYCTHVCGTLAAVTNGEMNNRIELLDWIRHTRLTLDADTGSTGNSPDEVFLAPPYLLHHSRSSRHTHVYDLRRQEWLGGTNGQVGIRTIPFVVGEAVCLAARWTDVPDVPGLLFRRRAEAARQGGQPRSADAVCDIWGYAATVSAVARDGARTLVGGHVVDVYDRLDQPPVGCLEGHSELITSIHPAGDALLTTSHDGTIRIWDRRRPQAPPAGGRFHQPPISALEREGESVFAGTLSGTIEEWDWRTATLRASASAGTAVRVLAANDRWLVHSTFDHPKRSEFTVRDRRRWTDPAASAPVRAGGSARAAILEAHQAVVGARLCGDSCAVVVRPYYTPDNSLGGGPFTGNWICVADLATDTVELVVGEWVSAVDLSADLVVAGTAGGEVNLWTRSGAPVWKFPAHEGLVLDLRVCGEWLFTCGVDRMVRSWQLRTGIARRAFGPFAGPVTGLHVRGRLLVTAAEDQCVTVFDRYDGRELARFDDDVAVTRAVALGDDLATFAAGGMSGFLHVLRANGPLRAVFGASPGTGA
ncbi:NB-ARC domain-containing protein [Nonomuraea sp. NPDC050540]|uniref:NB-ARC domain-containing protein n=1 Tax=Nonomuraea sp. NPDC050540 TaxID=3364367 RepID=UPI0037B9CA55